MSLCDRTFEGGKDGIEIDQMVRLTACYSADFFKPEVVLRGKNLTNNDAFAIGEALKTNNTLTDWT